MLFIYISEAKFYTGASFWRNQQYHPAFFEIPIIDTIFDRQYGVILSYDVPYCLETTEVSSYFPLTVLQDCLEIHAISEI